MTPHWVGGNVSGAALNLDALLCVQPAMLSPSTAWAE
jgi:hypothetical protein